MYQGTSFNQDVTRKFNLANSAAIEVTTDVRFRPVSSDQARSYYHIIPASLAPHLVSISAVITTTQGQAKVQKVDVSSLPSDLKTVLKNKNAAGDVVIYKLSTTKDEQVQGVVTFQITELFKRRKSAFPSQVAIKEELSVMFTDTKHYVSLYPTKKQSTTFNHNSPTLHFYTPDATAEKKLK